MARLSEVNGDLADAIIEYKRALNFDYNSASLHLRLASVYIKNNNLDSAIRELNLTAKYNPEAIESYGLLTIVYSLQKKYDLATKEYEKFLRLATKLDPQNIQLYKDLGQVYLEQNNLEAAEKTYRLILELQPKEATGHLFLGTVYEKQGKTNEAIGEFTKTIGLNPDDHIALNALGYLYAQEGINLDEAEAMIKKALEFESNNGAYIDSLGWVYFKKGMLEPAIKELERAANLLDDPVIFEHLGDAYFKKGEFIKARESWQKSLGIDPKQTNIKEKIEKLKSTK
jgi:tetratricopeptide (TPR) repeat protein